MASMKNASKTGATGFGQLNQGELKVLQDGATALKKTMSWDDAKLILDDMKVKLNKIISQRTLAPTESTLPTPSQEEIAQAKARGAKGWSPTKGWY
jgi:hypothetical protein